jgi:hypothetical protein
MKTFSHILAGVAFLCILIIPGCITAAETTASTEGVYRFVLPVEDGNLAAYRSVTIDGMDVRFSAEPDLDGREAFRGALPLGSDPDHWFGFLWDEQDLSLYVDLNRNFDLTDDPDGTIDGRPKGTATQRFADIIFTEIGGNPVRRCRVSVELERRDGGEVRCGLFNESRWRGTVDLGGVNRTIEIAENLDGVFDNMDTLHIDPPRTFNPLFARYRRPLPFTRTLIFDGAEYGIDYTITDDGSLAVTFTETDTPLDTLHIHGQSILRLIMKHTSPDDPLNTPVVILEKPDGDVRIPAGEYVTTQLILNAGPNRDWIQAANTAPISLSLDRPDTLDIGLPLRPSLKASFARGNLQLDYILLNKNGEEYGGFNPDPKNAPAFAVSLNGEKIASGSFRYG